MSAGAFDTSKYKSDGGAVWRCKIQPETKNLTIGSGQSAVTNAEPAEDISGDLPTAMVGGSRRRYGMHTRGIRIKFSGTPPTGYKPDSPIFLPILKKETFDSIARGATGTYLSTPIEVVGKVGEKIS